MGAFLILMMLLFAAFMYVALDGYDLGIGILLLGERDDARRKRMIELVATAWDGNESWLVLVGILMFCGFPLVYGTAMPALYVPLIVMLLALIFRGVSFEMQALSDGYARGWGRAFAFGSLMAAFAQGVALGGLLSGISRQGAVFTGSTFDFLTGFSVVTGLAAVALYVLAGAAWMQFKTEGEISARMARRGRVAALLVGVLAAAACVLLVTGTWGAAMHVRGDTARVAAAVWAGLGVLTALLLATWSFGRRPDWRPFAALLAMEAAGMLALVLLVYPVIEAPSTTLTQAASPPSTQAFILIGVGLCIPVVLTYNAYAYWVFRGKFTPPGLSTGRAIRGVQSDGHLLGQTPPGVSR